MSKLLNITAFASLAMLTLTGCKEEQKTSEYEYVPEYSGDFDVALSCLNPNGNGFEFYLVDAEGDPFQASITNINRLTNELEYDHQLDLGGIIWQAMIVPIIGNEPVVAQLMQQNVKVEPTEYIIGWADVIMDTGRYISSYEYREYSVPLYKVFRNGAGVEISFNWNSDKLVSTPTASGIDDSFYGPCEAIEGDITSRALGILNGLGEYYVDLHAQMPQADTSQNQF